MINVGGQKVLPFEVESVVMDMSEVADVTAYGEKNLITGQSVIVDIVLHREFQDFSAAQVRSYCRDQLDKYKVPTKVNFVGSLETSGRFKKKRLQTCSE